jgi:hypothetical protein
MASKGILFSANIFFCQYFALKKLQLFFFFFLAKSIVLFPVVGKFKGRRKSKHRKKLSLGSKKRENKEIFKILLSGRNKYAKFHFS